MSTGLISHLDSIAHNCSSITYSPYISSFSTINSNQFPIRTTEKDNYKIYQYYVNGINKNNIVVKKNFVNKTKTLTLTVKGNFKDEVTELMNNVDICVSIDYSIYNKVTWKVKDGILTVVLYEIINDEPELVVSEE